MQRTLHTDVPGSTGNTNMIGMLEFVANCKKEHLAQEICHGTDELDYFEYASKYEYTYWIVVRKIKLPRSKGQ